MKIGCRGERISYRLPLTLILLLIERSCCLYVAINRYWRTVHCTSLMSVYSMSVITVVTMSAGRMSHRHTYSTSTVRYSPIY